MGSPRQLEADDSTVLAEVIGHYPVLAALLAASLADDVRLGVQMTFAVVALVLDMVIPVIARVAAAVRTLQTVVVLLDGDLSAPHRLAADDDWIGNHLTTSVELVAVGAPALVDFLRGFQNTHIVSLVEVV